MGVDGPRLAVRSADSFCSRRAINYTNVLHEMRNFVVGIHTSLRSQSCKHSEGLGGFNARSRSPPDQVPTKRTRGR